MKRNIFSPIVLACALLSTNTLATHCPSMMHAISEIKRTNGNASPIVAVFHDPSHSETLWQAITVSFEDHMGRGDYWNFVIAEISAKTQDEARQIAEKVLLSRNGHALGSLSRNGHLFCGYTMAPPYLAAAKTPLEVPANATYDDVE